MKILLIIPRILIMSLIISLILCGCNQNEKKSEPETEQLQSKEDDEDKVPDQLKSIETSIEKIIKTLDGPSVEIEESSNQESEDSKDTKESAGSEESQGNEKSEKSDENKGQTQDKENESKPQDSEQNNKEQSQEKKSEGSDTKDDQTQQSGQSKDENPKDPWKEIDTTINKLHYQWNNYKPMALKMNASNNLIDSFSTSLNGLTNTIISKNKTNTLLASSLLYSNIPDFFMLYKSTTSPEIKRIRYYTRNAILNSMTANWTQAESDINNLKSNWTLYKNIIAREQQEYSTKLEYSITELEKVIQEKNQPLVDIKGRVALANIQELEKELEKQSETKTDTQK